MMRRPHIIILIVGALLWVGIWYGVGSLIYWFFGGR
jgi:hypothetical protein